MNNTHSGGPDYGVMVHCHLRWDFVWQRPQHIVSRLSQSHPVLFVEDPAPLPEGESEPRMQITRVSDRLTVARPLLHPHVGDPVKDAETDKRNAPIAKRLLDEAHAGLGWERLVHWFYIPMILEVRNWYDPVAIAYDCMDEIASFKGAPEDTRAKEAQLMRVADVVFTGGPSMYQARKDKHPNVHQFNSGVDVGHFRRALDPSTRVPDDIADLPRPLLLYYGVIDERMGWDNLQALSEAHPEWSIVLVGPLAEKKITEDELLRRPNIHYTGQRSYDELPGYLKGCDVALIPFALSDATRYLSPTKTLEYFAARRPVVSTPIQDIVDHYADAAWVASTPEEFVRACETALAQDNTARLDQGEQHAQAQTWDSIVDRMHHLLDEAVARKLQQPPAPGSPARDPSAGAEVTTGRVRWYSPSRGAGVVDTGGGDEVMAFLPGSVQEDLGGVKEGDAVAVLPASPAPATGEEHAANLFPLELDKRVGDHNG